MSPWLSWTETLPGNWKAVPLRAAVDFTVSNVDKIPADDELRVRLCNYSDVYNNEFITAEMDFMHGTATPAEIKKFGLQVGDVPITKDSEEWDDIGIPALVAQTADDLVCGYHLALLRPRTEKLDGRFLFRCLQAKTIRIYLELAANGVTRFGIPKDEIGKLPLPLPPLPEQRAIADFLDRETARLDALVAAKARWLELLAEKRRALITRAVTRGFNPKAPVKDSGIAWLEKIPAHWEIWKIGHFSEVGNGSTPARDSTDYWNGGTIPWLNSSVVNQFEATEAEQFVTESALKECHLPIVRPGSLLVGITGQGKTRGSVVVLSIEATINQHLAFITPDLVRTGVWFLRWVLFIAYDFLRVISDDAGGTKGALTCEELAEFRIPLPALDEQCAIVAYISRETAKLDALRAATDRTIGLLKERRAALIAAAVTGRIEVGARKR